MTKRILLSLILWGGVVLCANAQRSDGFFKGGNDDIYNNRGEISNNITLGGVTNNENPTEAPLGSGLLIMVAAGAGYAVARRKNAVRKGMTILLACALMLGLAQCKKNTVTPVTPSTTENRINITLNANTGGEKTTFDPENGTFNWLQGYGSTKTEYINVGGSKSGYLGQLTNGSNIGFGNFTGTITTPQSNETLYFFYLGNGNHAGATTVDFSNQDGTVTNVTNYHIAIGSQEYTGQTSFSATLEMAMAIAYFDLSGFNNDSKSAEIVYISGANVYSRATIDYTNGTITGCKNDYVKVGTASSGMYVALIPSVDTETTINFVSNSKNGTMTFLRGIQKGSYYSNSGSALAVTASEGGGIHAFSVSATKQVFFSKGNLQYQASTNTWRFAEHQYDFVGDATNGNVYVGAVKSDNSQIAADYSGWIDLFGYGTSGYEGKYPYMTSTTTGDYINQNLTGSYANYDWGVYNSSNITNGEGYTTWRTLTKDEWGWIFGPSYQPNPGTNCRIVKTSGLTGTDDDKARFVKGTVNGVKGIIIFPDVYAQPTEANVTYNSPSYNGYYSDFTKFVVTSGWEYMEYAGAIFLPIAGYRNDKSILWTLGSYTNVTFYHSVNKSGDNYSYKVYLHNSGFNSQASTTPSDINKTYGLAVRLVRE